MVNKSMSNLGIRLANSGAKPLQTNNQNRGMVGPGEVVPLLIAKHLAQRCGQFGGFECKRKLWMAPAPRTADLLPVIVPSDHGLRWCSLKLRTTDL
jgi:hypothetical protein